MYYQKHIFFCINQRDSGRKSCGDADATSIQHYTKKRIKDLHLAIDIRVNNAGCLGRCEEGPTMVIYPEGVWYTYSNTADIDEIIDKHILKGEIVTRLLMPPKRPKEA